MHRARPAAQPPKQPSFRQTTILRLPSNCTPLKPCAAAITYTQFSIVRNGLLIGKDITVQWLGRTLAILYA